MNKVMKIILLAIVLCAPILSLAQDKPSKAEIKELITLRGGTESYLSTIDILVDRFSQGYPDVEQSIWLDIRKELAIKYLDRYLDALVPVYKNHFNASEVRALIKFYKSPEGKKLVEKTPMITTESVRATQSWNEEVGRMIADKIGLSDRAE